MFKKSFLALTVAGLAAAANPASALTFCPSGGGLAGGGCVQFEVIDPAPGNSIAGATAATAPGSPDFNVFYQANLGSMQLANTQPTFGNGQGGNFFTFVLGFQELVTSQTNVGGSVTEIGFGYSPQNLDGGCLPNCLSNNPADPNFFYMYDVPAIADNLAGTGFVSTTPILTGYTIGDSFSSIFRAEGPAPADLVECGAGDGPIGCLDQGGVGVGGGVLNNYPGVDSVLGTGSTNIRVVITSFNAGYFPDLPAGALILLDTNTSTNLPYEQIDPSNGFSSTGQPSCNGCLAGVPAVGQINGLGGTPNFLTANPNDLFAGSSTVFQSDANASIVTQVQAEVPEPATLTLLGVGLLGSAAARRRQKKNAQK